MSGSRRDETPDSPPGAPTPGPKQRSDDGKQWGTIVREIAVSVLIVLVIAAILFGISGVWPPLVAVESDSMEPHINTGDLVFIVEADRFVNDGAVEGTGVVPADRANEHGQTAFDRPGDVIIFAPNGDGGETPIIHRAHLWVEEDENWYDRTDENLVGNADSCDDLSSCPAPHAGFITHGDNNAFYDQVQRDNDPVKADWILARAHLRIPWVGHLRLVLSEVLAFSIPAIVGAGHASNTRLKRASPPS